MLKVGLTGGIASGKSVVAEIFAALGAHVIYADAIAHQLMQPGKKVYQEVVTRFGAGILAPDGRIDRAKLAEIAFGSPARGQPSRVLELNQIVHPAVVAFQDEWMDEVGRQDPHAIAIVEAALIVEAGAQARFDCLVLVTCRPEQRVRRLAERLKIDEAAARREVERRMATQLSDTERLKFADYVIDNSGSLDASRDQVRQVYLTLREQAG